MMLLPIRYELIGTRPSCERFRETLPEVISDFKSSPSGSKAETISDCAAHFYGLSYATDFSSIDELIDAMTAIEEHARFH